MTRDDEARNFLDTVVVDVRKIIKRITKTSASPVTTFNWLFRDLVKVLLLNNYSVEELCEMVKQSEKNAFR